ncbi:hypothetical protein ACFYN0_21150 [Streptomyces sp. NPDC006704]|uniref:hypothetical protein n=1 Tax=Streptomyces sp. NPDC006704 TaxID=3364760 RepID=UPI0036A6B980
MGLPGTPAMMRPSFGCRPPLTHPAFRTPVRASAAARVVAVTAATTHAATHVE